MSFVSAARVECPALTRRCWVSPCRPGGLHYQAAHPSSALSEAFRKLIDKGFLQMSNGVFVSKLRLLFSPFHPNLTSKFFLVVSGHLISLHCSHTTSWGVGVKSVVWTRGQHGQWVSLPTWCEVLAGCQALVVWGNAVSSFAESLVSCKNKTKSLSIILPTFLL